MGKNCRAIFNTGVDPSDGLGSFSLDRKSLFASQILIAIETLYFSRKNTNQLRSE